MRLLLLSNSTLPGEPFFTWPRAHVRDFLGSHPLRIAFVPFAAARMSLDEYTAVVRPVFAEMGHEVIGMKDDHSALEAVSGADAVAVGGGNSFLLLHRMQRTGLLKALAGKMRDGMPYIGWSAGANVACPTIMTTNDMPIVQPASFSALGLVPFQINPHFTEETIPGHGGESREQRIAEFLAVNPAMSVVGLREGSLLRVSGGTMTLEGRAMKLFRAGQEVAVVAEGSVMRPDLGEL